MDVFDWVMGHFPTKHLKSGYFVEAGAHDGVGDSQTLRLELAGWRGLCVEPSSAFSGLVKSRKCSMDCRPLCGKDHQEVIFREVHGNAIELSGIRECFYDHWDRETRPHTDRVVVGITLATMLQQHNAPRKIDLLCLDTEGSELEILEAHDFDRYRFTLVQVEHNGVAPRRDGLRRLLEGRGYGYDSTDGVNDRYSFPARRA